MHFPGRCRIFPLGTTDIRYMQIADQLTSSSDDKRTYSKQSIAVYSQATSSIAWEQASCALATIEVAHGIKCVDGKKRGQTEETVVVN